MYQDAQQHNWIPTKTIILAQQAKEASTYKMNEQTKKSKAKLIYQKFSFEKMDNSEFNKIRKHKYTK